MVTTAPLRLAMWSGPRNISTAMMRSWGNRPDTFVTDEPLYACYLAATGVGHPGREAIIERYETDWREVVRWLTGPPPEGKPIWYQKHMSHHLLPEMDRGWLDHLTHCFLIRHPEEVLTSFIKVVPNPSLEDTGLPQQVEILDHVHRTTGRTPPVLDARDVLEDPRGLLERLCAELGVDFSERMLSWPAGRRPTDGIWAPYWYGAVESSTGFAPYRPKDERVPEGLRGLLDECMVHYERLHGRRLLV